MNIVKRINTRKILQIFAAALVIMTGALAVVPGTAKAATYGIYTVTATPYYQHPVTGVMEDSGKNPGIGQGMTESVLAKQALLEVDQDGNHFVTVRFSLMDNINDVKLSVQKNAQSGFVAADHTVMKEVMEEGTADLRFAVPGENAIARAEFYVIPMGRDVVFYMTFSNPIPGSGDFVTSIKIDESAAAQQRAQSGQTQLPAPTAAPSASIPAASIDPNAGLTVYENNAKPANQPAADSAGEPEQDNTLVLFIIIALAVVAASGIAGFAYYKKKVGKAAPIKREGEKNI